MSSVELPRRASVTRLPVKRAGEDRLVRRSPISACPASPRWLWIDS